MRDDRKSGAEACERPAKRAKLMCQWEDPSNTFFVVAFFALIVERNNLKNCSEAINFESQCFFGLATEAKKLQEKSVGR